MEEEQWKARLRRMTNSRKRQEDCPMEEECETRED